MAEDKITGMFFARQLQGISSEQLAKELGVGRSMISMWENGRKEISEKRMEELEDVLLLDREYLQKEVTFEEKIDIVVCMKNFVYRKVLREEGEKLEENMSNINLHTIQENRRALAKMENVKMLWDLSDMCLNQEENNSSDMNELLYYVLISTQIGGRLMKKITKVMKETLEQSIAGSLKLQQQK